MDEISILFPPNPYFSDCNIMWVLPDIAGCSQNGEFFSLHAYMVLCGMHGWLWDFNAAREREMLLLARECSHFLHHHKSSASRYI